MLRALIVAAVAVFMLLVGTGLVLFMAYGITDGHPEVVHIARLSDSLTVDYFEDGTTSVSAAQRQDAFVALGYLHAHEHAWSMALWRQTAAGRLSEWYGAEMLPLDRMARRLGIARSARAAYNLLPDDERRLLEAYASGVNAVFGNERARLTNEFVVLETVPEPWQPWHSLAVERLFAWMSVARPSAVDLEATPPSLQEFFRSDRLLRDWLHLHGFEHGVVWSIQDSTGTTLVNRQVYGASALPIFQPVRMAWNGTDPRLLVTLIGTPFAPTGRADARAWAVLMSSDLMMVPAWRDTSSVPIVYERIRTAEGREHLMKIFAAGGELFFPGVSRAPSARAPQPAEFDTLGASAGIDRSAAEDTTSAGFATNAAVPAADGAVEPRPETAADTSSGMVPGWTLQWTGFGDPTDAASWIALMESGSPSFELFKGDGILLDRSGATTGIGTPSVDVSLDAGRLIGNSIWSHFVADRLDSLRGPELGIDTIELLNDLHSTWAAELAPPLTDAAIAVPEHAQLVTEALTYLRNWDFAFDRASIAASIFDRWLSVYHDSLGRWPVSQISDSALAENLLRYETLVQTVELLTAEFGDDPTRWRWERIQPHRYYFPGWSADSLTPGPQPGARYTPIELPGTGHPTTSYFGPVATTGSPSSPARWVSWISTSEWETLHYRSRRFPANRFFGRYLVSDRLPEPQAIQGMAPVKQSIQMVPGI